MTSFWFSGKPFLFLVVCIMLILPAVSLTCTSKNFTGRESYPLCLDLVLSSYLHYRFDPGNTTLAIVFSAKPPNPAGWISWGINPKGLGMIGTQALVAYRESNGHVVARTYRIDSYEMVVRSNLSIHVWDLKTEEYHDGGFRIFAKIKVPADMAAAKKVYHIWQVGAGITDDGQLGTHEFEDDNLAAMSKLNLAVKADGRPDGSPGSAAFAGNIYDQTSSAGPSTCIQNAAFYMFGPILRILLSFL